MEVNFRRKARLALDQAAVEIDSGDHFRLKYVALELRFAIEYIIYDRAISYGGDFLEENWETWQPKQILEILSDINPEDNVDLTLNVEITQENCDELPIWHTIGSESVLSLKFLKQHYSALGSYLHAPSISAIKKSQGINYVRLKERLQIIVVELNKILSSTLFNVKVQNASSINCEKCGSVIKKYKPMLIGREKEINVDCSKCSASYTLDYTTDNWNFNRTPVKCQNPHCDREKLVWHRDIQPGTFWICSKCNGKNQMVLTVVYDAKK